MPDDAFPATRLCPLRPSGHLACLVAGVVAAIDVGGSANLPAAGDSLAK